MNNNLSVINHNGQWVVDSREVAEMVGKEHKILMRDIRTYIQYMGTTLNPSSFFIESTYLDSYGREKSCYLLTKKGCNMVANKMTGEKGILFTATYVSKFEEMEKQIKSMALRPDSYMIEDPITRAKRWIEEQEEKQLLEARVEVLEPKANRYDKYMNSDGTIDMAEFAKVLKIKLNGKKAIGRNLMFELLRDMKILNKGNLPMQQYIDRGYFEVIWVTKYNRPYPKTLITPSGADWLIGKIEEKVNNKKSA